MKHRIPLLATGLITTAGALSLVSGSMSVVGMASMFPGAPLAVGAMMATVEVAKVVAAAWTHHVWGDRRVNGAIKAYLTGAVTVTAGLTGMGVYGFLAGARTGHAAHLDAAARAMGVETDGVVQAVMIALVAVVDPMAIALMIAGTSALAEHVRAMAPAKPARRRAVAPLRVVS